MGDHGETRWGWLPKMGLLGGMLILGSGASAETIGSSGDLFPAAGGTGAAAPATRSAGDTGAGGAKTPATTMAATAPAPAPAISPPATEAAPVVVKKMNPPAGVALRDAIKLVDEVYKDDIAAAKTAAQREPLERKLLGEGRQEKDMAGRFALLAKVRDMGMEDGEIEMVAEAIGEMDTAFAIDSLKMNADAAAALSKVIRTLEQRKAMVEMTRKFVDAAVMADRYDIGRGLVDDGVQAARASGEPSLQKEAGTTAQNFHEIEAAFGDIKSAAAALAANAGDAEANLKVGKFRCFFKGDWKAGLPLLVLCGDKTLADLARRDLAGATAAPAEQVKIGDGWWDLGQAWTGLAKTRAQGRAYTFYEEAAPELSGLAKAKVEKRMREAEAVTVAVAGAPAEEKDFVTKLLNRIPKELLPAKEDTQEQMRDKSQKLARWRQENLSVDPAGTSVTVVVKFGGTTVYSTNPTPGVGLRTTGGMTSGTSSAGPGGAGGAGQQNIQIRFRDQLDFKGIPCRVNVTLERPNLGPESKENQLVRALDKGGMEASYALTVTAITISVMSSRPMVSDGRGQYIQSGSPTLVVSIRSTEGPIAVKPVAGR